MRKENILVIIALIIFFYALFLNIFSPFKKEEVGYNKRIEEVGVKTDFKASVSEYISEEVSGLGFGYLLGEKSELPSGVENKMKAVGLAHIIVVSGTHLSIIIGASRKIFGKISRFAALYFSVFLLLGYILLIGVSPSITRASFVAILSMVAWYFGREQRVFRTIIYTLGFCLAVNPYYLTSVSFQLSMLAYSGVVVILPILIRYFYGRDGPGFIGSVILSSLSAIIACLPIQLFYFGTLNFISLFANLLILPTIPYAMGAIFLTGLLGMLNFDFLAMGIGKIAELILNYHVRVISELYDKTEFMFEVEQNNPIWLGLYGVIILLVFVAIHKNIKVGKSDARNHDDTPVGFDKRENVLSKVVERNKERNTPRTK